MTAPDQRVASAARARAAALVFVADLDRVALQESDVHHLDRVLRLRAGQPVTASDGNGSWRSCVVPVGGLAAAGGRLEVVGDIAVDPAPSAPFGVAFALTKGEKPELVVQKLTELGAARIIVFAAEHSVARWDELKAARNLDRLRSVAREAAMQSRRSRLPIVEQLADFARVAEQPGLAIADLDGSAPGIDLRLVAIGPEGGWSEAERTLARHRGVPFVSFASNVLRAETAAIAAAAICGAMRSGVVSPSRTCGD